MCLGLSCSQRTSEASMKPSNWELGLPRVKSVLRPRTSSLLVEDKGLATRCRNKHTRTRAPVLPPTPRQPPSLSGSSLHCDPVTNHTPVPGPRASSRPPLRGQPYPGKDHVWFCCASQDLGSWPQRTEPLPLCPFRISQASSNRDMGAQDQEERECACACVHECACTCVNHFTQGLFTEFHPSH